MNLRNIVRNAVTTINPDISAVVKVSNGWQTLPTGKRVPQYLPDKTVKIQFQPMSNEDVKQLDGMNLSGIIQSIHVDGNYYGVNRGDQRGGDIFIVNGKKWMVVKVLELWPEWCRLVVQLQID